MIRSMTGFGEAAEHNDGVHYFLEIRSLNGKYFKSTIRLPEELQGLEPVLEAAVRRSLVRGTITIVGKCSDRSEAAAHEINHQALDAYIQQLRKTPDVADGSCQINATDLLALPGVLQPPSDDEERYELAKKAFLKLTKDACARLDEMRRSEGALLVDDLLGHHEVIGERLNRIAERAPRVVEDYQQRLLARIQSLLEDAKARVDPTDLIKEVAVYAERSDISEEVARLSGHLQQFRSIVKDSDGKAVGRTLDFLAQEMLREANTIASKSSDADISKDIVEVKGAIDRIKEQVQNVL